MRKTKSEPVYPIVADYVKLVAKAKDTSLSYAARERAKTKAIMAFEVMTGKARGMALRAAGSVVNVLGGEYEE